MSFTQVLKIEIDGCHPHFHRNHTPGIVGTLRDIADCLNKNGVQMIRYPFYVYGDPSKETIIAKIDLVENESGEEFLCSDCHYVGDLEEAKDNDNHCPWCGSGYIDVEYSMGIPSLVIDEVIQ